MPTDGCLNLVRMKHRVHWGGKPLVRVDPFRAVWQHLRVDRATDQELLLAWKSGETDAGERLFDRHYEAVSRFFQNNVDDSHRGDIV